MSAFAAIYPEDMHIVQLDQSMVHRTANLQIPPNEAFYFQLPYSPDLNPIEQLWAVLKGRLSNCLWLNLKDLQQALSYQLGQLTKASLRSLMQRTELVEALAWAGMPFKAV